MIDIEQIRCAVALIEQKMAEEKHGERDFIMAVGTLMIAAIGSLASISNSLEVIQRDLDQLNRERQSRGVRG